MQPSAIFFLCYFQDERSYYFLDDIFALVGGDVKNERRNDDYQLFIY